MCTEAEKKLKAVDKWMQVRVATLNETKANFAFIYEKLREIKKLEEDFEKNRLLQGHRTYEEISAVS